MMQALLPQFPGYIRITTSSSSGAVKSIPANSRLQKGTQPQDTRTHYQIQLHNKEAGQQTRAHP